ncbi:unnamed protein product [Medioppia subpectinata]|uniref:Hexosyltransferase n=1 Tax=Medioppia subpectinata TaxID=1979941 RepID=A0A7R9KE25_9ACAR|nr:unnamed protein product [Medioppia subpectinata]CAG2100435.1 unnamed protein product [Medioppia subpectinata]
MRGKFLNQRLFSTESEDEPIVVDDSDGDNKKTSGRRLWTNQMATQTGPRKYRFNVIFVLALPRDYSHNTNLSTTQTAITQESQQFNDILQLAFMDAYYNLTLKAIGILNWVLNNCLTNDYIFKADDDILVNSQRLRQKMDDKTFKSADDDILVNSQRLRQKMDDKTFKSGFTGVLSQTNHKPIRDINDKFYVPKEVYDKDYYPLWLYNSAISDDHILLIDDLYLTGIIAQKSNIKRYNSDEFVVLDSDEVCKTDVCDLHTMCAFHGCNQTPNQTIELWMRWKNTTPESLRYEHTLQEIELTRRVLIEPKCESNWTPIFVYSAARTSGKYYLRRKATREGWALEARKYRFNVIFVLALPRDYTHNNTNLSTTQTAITQESQQFNDILQLAFIDDYYNITLKGIGILNWVLNKCSTHDYIVKADDDILVNSQRLRQKMDDKTFKSGITGQMLTHKKPYRDINDKWYVPKYLYDKDYYPPYVLGGAYIISADIIESLHNSAISNDHILYIEDLYLTGIIRQKYNIEIHNNDEFVILLDDVCKTDVCDLYTVCAFHGCNQTPNQTIELWMRWKNTTPESCHINNLSPNYTKVRQ